MPTSRRSSSTHQICKWRKRPFGARPISQRRRLLHSRNLTLPTSLNQPRRRVPPLGPEVMAHRDLRPLPHRLDSSDARLAEPTQTATTCSALRVADSWTSWTRRVTTRRGATIADRPLPPGRSFVHPAVPSAAGEGPRSRCRRLTIRARPFTVGSAGDPINSDCPQERL